MSQPDLRIAVLISGTGSNLKTLIDARDQGRLPIEIVKVISNRAEAPGLAHAQNAGIGVTVINEQDRDAQDQAIAGCLQQLAPDLVILAGYMRILGAGLVDAFPGRMINLHPSLLPRFRGLHTYQRVLEAGDSEHGASIHFVTPELDGGPVIAQVRMPVLPDDSAASLAARLAPLEHRMLVAVVELFTRGRVQMRHGKALLDGNVMFRPLFLGEDAGFD